MLNRILLQGRIVRDPELRHTASGIAVCSFTLAVDRDARTQDGARQTDFIDCVAWAGAAEFVCRYFNKGSAAIVDGKLELRDWTDKDGNKRRSAEVRVSSIYFGGSKKSESNADAAADNGFAELSDDDGELPF